MTLRALFGSLPALLDLAAARGLTFQQKRLWILTFSTEFERSEVLEPGAFRHVRGMPAPLLQRKEILHRDTALLRAVKQMAAKVWRQVQPFELWHQWPKVIRASSSRRRSVSLGSVDF